MAHRKNNPCKNCGGTFFDGSRTDDDQPIWTCRNCYEETPRQVRKSAKRKEVEALIDEMLAELG